MFNGATSDLKSPPYEETFLNFQIPKIGILLIDLNTYERNFCGLRIIKGASVGTESESNWNRGCD